jgi:hypothetical protein
VLRSQKYDLNWGLQQLPEAWTKNFKTSPAEENDVEMTGDGEGTGEPSRDEDDFEKQVDQLEEWLWKNQFRTSRMTTSARKASLTIAMATCQGTLM